MVAPVKDNDNILIVGRRFKQCINLTLHTMTSKTKKSSGEIICTWWPSSFGSHERFQLVTPELAAVAVCGAEGLVYTLPSAHTLQRTLSIRIAHRKQMRAATMPENKQIGGIQRRPTREISQYLISNSSRQHSSIIVRSVIVIGIIVPYRSV